MVKILLSISGRKPLMTFEKSDFIGMMKHMIMEV